MVDVTPVGDLSCVILGTANNGAARLVHAARPARFIAAMTAFLASDASPVDPPA